MPGQKRKVTFCVVSSFPNSDCQGKRSFSCGLWICFWVSMDGWFFLFWGQFIAFLFVSLYLCIFVSLFLCWAFSSCSGWRHSSLWCTGFSLKWLLLLQSTGSRCTGSAVGANTLSCSTAYGILVPGPRIEPMSSALASRFLITGHQILNHWTPSFFSFCVLRTWLGNCQVGIAQNMAKQKCGLYPICS